MFFFFFHSEGLIRLSAKQRKDREIRAEEIISGCTGAVSVDRVSFIGRYGFG